MHRIAVCLAVLSSLAGCTDYKWGHNWKPDAHAGWVDETSPRGNTIVKTVCAAEPLRVTLHQVGETSVVALFMIPLFYSSPDDNYRSFAIVTSHPKLDNCAVRNPLVVKMDNQVIKNLEWSSRSSKGICIIQIPASEMEGESLSIEVDQNVLPCTAAPITFKKKSYFCLRDTKFGGSPACDD